MTTLTDLVLGSPRTDERARSIRDHYVNRALTFAYASDSVTDVETVAAIALNHVASAARAEREAFTRSEAFLAALMLQHDVMSGEREIVPMPDRYGDGRKVTVSANVGEYKSGSGRPADVLAYIGRALDSADVFAPASEARESSTMSDAIAKDVALRESDRLAKLAEMGTQADVD